MLANGARESAWREPQEWCAMVKLARHGWHEAISPPLLPSFNTGAAEYHIDKGYYDCKIKASMLSLGTIYVASLMFKFPWDPSPSNVMLMRIKWKTDELSMPEDEEVEGLKSLSITDEEDTDDDEYWEKKLPDEYPCYIAMSD
ncbi:hypothetical protein Tco_0026972 [Tanacetum coccineum]